MDKKEVQNNQQEKDLFYLLNKEQEELLELTKKLDADKPTHYHGGS